MKRYVEEPGASGVTSGYLYTKRPGQRSKLADFSEVFYEPLESIQRELDSVIPADLDIRKESGQWRTIRKGVTAHAINCKVELELVNAIHRWRDEFNQRRPNQMVNVYAEETLQEDNLYKLV